MHDFGDENFFKEINQVFDDFDYSKTASRRMYAYIVYLANLVFNMEPVAFQNHEETSIYHDISQSLVDVKDFFEFLNPEYAYRFQNILHAPLFNFDNVLIGKSVKFIHKDAKDVYNAPTSTVDTIGRVQIYYTNTMIDIIDIAHEMTHKFSIQCTDGFESCIGEIFDFFCEVPTSTIEYLGFDYFKDKYDYNVFKNRIMFRLRYTWGYARQIVVESRLFELFKNNKNHLSNEILNDYILKNKIEDDYEINYIKRILTELHKEKECNYEISKRYLLGGIIGAYLYEQICIDPNNNQQLFDLIEVLGTNDYTKRRSCMKLSSIGFPYTKLWRIKTDPKQMQELVSVYQNYVSKVVNDVPKSEYLKLSKM